MKDKTRSLILAAIFSAIMALCSWIQIPAPVPFTLQTLGIYLCCGLLGGKTALISVGAYILLGMVGLPVFSGFSGGISSLFGATGGFVFGFLFVPACVWISENTPYKNNSLFLGGGIGTILCYTSGTFWYSTVYMRGDVGIYAAFITCVLPFLLPDVIKLIAAREVSKRIAPKIPKI